MKLFHIIAQKT